MLRKLYIHTIIVLAMAVGCANTAWGQGNTSLTGTVTDPSGAVVPGAAISIQNDATHASRQVTSDSAGRYSFLQVQPGTSRRRGSAQGGTAGKHAYYAWDYF
jgi:protocatechuate 3,4-dioxygenase beta subunit